MHTNFNNYLTNLAVARSACIGKDKFSKTYNRKSRMHTGINSNSSKTLWIKWPTKRRHSRLINIIYRFNVGLKFRYNKMAFLIQTTMHWIAHFSAESVGQATHRTQCKEMLRMNRRWTNRGRLWQLPWWHSVTMRNRACQCE